MWPNMPIDYIILPNDEQGIHFGLFVNNTLISVVSLFIENKEAQFRKLATTNLEQGKGYGGRLLSHLITYAEGKKVNKIWCNARVDKKDFYLKFGFKSTNTVFIKHKIDYVVMEKMIIR
ncbi:GNAT family N-acetyltransferase [Arenibacter sp. BSSL-BM3]|uniref:GNAT family N-acetyltransferase n=2 Tax=Arenibacter arenosicollis TaxID=2762274 RepID=A0ABR7QML9_9FLAO|nr:GNAT family N-acetyltransferase [Arenibacter arenosicollis]